MNYAHSCSCTVLACIRTIHAQKHCSPPRYISQKKIRGKTAKGSLFPAYSTSGRRQTWWLGAPQNRCRDRLRVKGQEAGQTRQRGAGRLASEASASAGCCSAGTAATTLPWRNSPEHFIQGANCPPGWSATTPDYS